MADRTDHSFETNDCPHDVFIQRVSAVDDVCCMQNGVDTCSENEVPSICGIECGIIYRSFFTECATWLQRILDDEFPAFEALNEQCEAHDTHELLEAMNTATCTVPAMSCAE